MTAMTITTKLLSLMASVLALTPVPTEAFAQRQMERLGRGVVAVNQGDGKVFISWRLLGNDPEATAFNLYRAASGATASSAFWAQIIATISRCDAAC